MSPFPPGPRGVRDNLPKDNLPKPNLPNVKDSLPNFFRQYDPLNLPNFVGTTCRIPSIFKKQCFWPSDMPPFPLVPGLGTICRKTICRKLTQGQFAEFFSANCPYEFAEFCRDNLPNMPPFPLVPRGPLGPPMFPSC